MLDEESLELVEPSLELVEQSGEDSVAKKSKKRTWRKGEFSDKQLALKKLEKEGDDAIFKTRTWPPTFLATITKMQGVL